ncbi:MAG: hypothetical protein ACFFAN_01465 [Promethearchaeota archaeon]
MIGRQSSSAEVNLTNVNLEDFTMWNLVLRIFRKKPDLLYFICKRGNWDPSIPFISRGIITDIEMSCKKAVRQRIIVRLSNTLKKVPLVRLKRRATLSKSFHKQLAQYCDLNRLGRAIFTFLKKKGADVYLQDNYTLEDTENFIREFLRKFNVSVNDEELILMELDEIKVKTGKKIPPNNYSYKDKSGNKLKISYVLKTRYLSRGNLITALIRINCSNCYKWFDSGRDRNQIEGNLLHTNSFNLKCPHCQSTFKISSNFYNILDFIRKRELKEIQIPKVQKMEVRILQEVQRQELKILEAEPLEVRAREIQRPEDRIEKERFSDEISFRNSKSSHFAYVKREFESIKVQENVDTRLLSVNVLIKCGYCEGETAFSLKSEEYTSLEESNIAHIVRCSRCQNRDTIFLVQFGWHEIKDMDEIRNRLNLKPHFNKLPIRDNSLKKGKRTIKVDELNVIRAKGEFTKKLRIFESREKEFETEKRQFEELIQQKKKELAKDKATFQREKMEFKQKREKFQKKSQELNRAIKRFKVKKKIENDKIHREQKNLEKEKGNIQRDKENLVKKKEQENDKIRERKEELKNEKENLKNEEKEVQIEWALIQKEKNAIKEGIKQIKSELEGLEILRERYKKKKENLINGVIVLESIRLFYESAKTEQGPEPKFSIKELYEFLVNMKSERNLPYSSDALKLALYHLSDVKVRFLIKLSDGRFKITKYFFSNFKTYLENVLKAFSRKESPLVI